MVKHYRTLPRNAEGQLDQERWLTSLGTPRDYLDQTRLRQACQFVQVQAPDAEQLDMSFELAQEVANLKLGSDAVIAALVYRSARTRPLERALIERAFGERVGQLVEAVLQTAQVSLLELSSARLQTQEARDQVDNVRRMMVALINDPSVAVIKLAERVVVLRHAKGSPEARQRRIAEEAMQVFAPLANRLGIWHLKWELEDLAFRYLDADTYRQIAKQLGGRRVERERRVSEIAADLADYLQAQGLEAQVSGRAKHIFSIWRKMQAKRVPLQEVYDVRAVRVLVPDIASCYTALGLIHTRWRHIPREFDDYIASPKDNGYRSIHTAVLGPEARTLEVQIRTLEMHEEAELGLCAHWAYKDGKPVAPEGFRNDVARGLGEDASYSEKVDWLRRVLEWRDGLETLPDGQRPLPHDAMESRIFVYTPGGHVLDFAAGATPVDFAYRVHTEIGHRCSGVLVNGLPEALNSPLQTGQRVEILTAPDAQPERLWLEAELGFLHTGRAREKVSEFFLTLPPERQIAEGERLLRSLLGRLGAPSPRSADWTELARTLDYDSETALFRAVGSGERAVFEVLPLLFDLLAIDQQSALPFENATGRVGLNVRSHAIAIRGEDRDGLLRDVAMLLSREDVHLNSTSAQSDARGHARILVAVRLPGLLALSRIMELLRAIPGVVEVRRVLQ